MVVEVDVKPFTTGSACLDNCCRYEPLADSLPTAISRHDRVEKKGMDAAVPSDIDEANEPVIATNANPAEAVLVDLTMPVVR